MNNEETINNNINLEEFFQVYPPMKKINSIESNKFNKLFIKPVKLLAIHDPKTIIPKNTLTILGTKVNVCS